MKKKRMLREMYIRVGITIIVVAIATLLLQADTWLWLFPVFVALMVWLKHRTADVD